MNKEINESKYVGKIYETKSSGPILVIEDLGMMDDTNRRRRFLKIKFLNTGNIQTIRATELSSLHIKDRYAKSVYGIGYLGDNKNYNKKEYSIWHGIIARCYNPDSSNYNLYGLMGVHVCDRWLNFSNFLEDLRKMENYDKLMAGEPYQIDKDILQPDKEYGKVYSPETCLLVLDTVNTAEVCIRHLKDNKVRYNGVGISEGKNIGYTSRISLNGICCNIGVFDTAKAAAACRDEIAWMYGKLELLNHTDMTIDEALKYRRTKFTKITNENIRQGLPPVDMCKIIDNTKLRDMCHTIVPVKRGY